MRKMRKLCALVLGTSMLLGNTGYAAEVVWEQEAAETVWTEGEELEGTRPVEYVTADLVEADLALLEEALPAKKEDFSKSVQRKMENVVTLAKDDAVLAAEKLNEIADQDIYEATLHEVLDSYYGEESAFSEAQIVEFAEAVDERAETMLADYAEAKEERDRQDVLDYRAGEVLATFKDGTTEEQIAEIAQYFGGKYHLLRTFPINENLPEDDLKRLEKVRDYKFPTIAAMTIGLDMTVEKGKELFEALECVSYVEADGIVRDPASIQSELGVNDEEVDDQRYLKQIMATDAWKTYRKSGTEIVAAQTYVAVIDTGLDITHEDLKNQYSKELSISFVKNGENVEIQSMNSDNCYWRDYDMAGHGTRVAGIIAAETNNQKGIVGITGIGSDLIKIIAINMFYDPYYELGEKKYSFDNKYLVEAIRYAVSNGAKVINMSFGNTGNDDGLQNVIDYAHEAGVVLCGSAGNDNENKEHYPSDFNHVISVSGVDRNNKKYALSNFGNNIDITAPATEIHTSDLNNNYNTGQGTSRSTPMVSATAAILASMRSANINKAFSPDEIESILYETATDLEPAGKDIYFGHGLLNVNLALQTAKQKFIANITPPGMNAAASGYDSITVKWQGVTWAERYLIFRSTEPNGTYTKIASLHCDETWATNSNGNGYWWYKDTGRKTGTKYYYKIRAAISYKDENTFRFSGYTPVVNATCVLNAPAGLTLTAATGKITASWKKVAGAEGYQIWRSESKNGTYKRIHTVTSGATLSYGDSTVKAGTTYYYKIRAYRKPDGTAVFSNYSAVAAKKAK